MSDETDYKCEKQGNTALCFFLLKRCTISPWKKVITDTIVAGKYESSIEISSIANCVIIVIGVDQGGDLTSLLARLLNWKGGNMSDYCTILGLVEYGIECYENLMKKLFNDDLPL